MENNGEISFLQKPEFRTPNLSDLNLPPPNDYLFANVILDGNIMTKNLQHIGKDVNWLKSELKKQGYSGSSEIFLATVSTEGELTVFPRSEQKNNRNYFE